MKKLLYLLFLIPSLIFGQSSTAPGTLNLTFQAVASSALTFTDQANAEQFLSNSNRNIQKVDLTQFYQVRLLVRVSTGSASANNPRLYVEYHTSFSTTIGDYSDIAGAAVSCSLTNTGLIDSGWQTLVAGAKADIFVSVLQNGGDGTADPAVAYIQVQFRTSGTAMNYTPIPSLPSFGTFTQIDPTDTNIQTADLGGNTDVILGNGVHSPRVLFNGLTGSSGTPIRFMGEGSNSYPLFNNPSTVTQIGDNSVPNDYSGKTSGSGSDFVYFYNLHFNGGTGYKNESQAKTHLIELCKISGGSFAGVLNKTDNNDAVTPYNSTYNFVWFEDQEGEFIYCGQVNGDTYHNIETVTATNCYGDGSGREGLQVAHTENLYANHITMLNLGQDFASGSAQRKCVQIEDSNNGTGYGVKNSIFAVDNTSTYADGQYGIFFTTSGVTVENNLIINFDPLYFQNAAVQDWYANSTIKNDDPILVKDNIIVVLENSYDKVARVFADICDITLTGNTIYSDAIDGLFEDGRSTTNYDLIDGGGNVILPLSSFVWPQFNSEGCVTNEPYYSLGMGYRNPNGI